MVLRIERRLHVFPDLESASRALAERLVERAHEAIADHRRFRWVISGGRTPLPLYRRLAEAYRRRIPWAATSVYFADERCVSPRAPESNFGSAWRTLLSRVSIPRSQVHRMQGELRPITEAARRYARRIGPLPQLERGECPRFDVVLLGIGPDGHTASLFPRQAALKARRTAVAAVPRAAQPPDVPRLTMTLPALSSAESVWFLVAGDDKAAALSGIFDPSRRTSDSLPAARVRPPGPSDWFVDRAAARRIPSSVRGGA